MKYPLYMKLNDRYKSYDIEDNEYDKHFISYGKIISDDLYEEIYLVFENGTLVDMNMIKTKFESRSMFLWKIQHSERYSCTEEEYESFKRGLSNILSNFLLDFSPSL